LQDDIKAIKIDKKQADELWSKSQKSYRFLFRPYRTV